MSGGVISTIIIDLIFRFLFENKGHEHIYYRWKLFSILQVGDSSFILNFKIIEFFIYNNFKQIYQIFFIFLPSGQYLLPHKSVSIECVRECVITIDAYFGFGFGKFKIQQVLFPIWCLPATRNFTISNKKNIKTS